MKIRLLNNSRLILQTKTIYAVLQKDVKVQKMKKK